MNRLVKIIVFSCFWICSGSAILAQSDKSLDSLISAASLKVYSQPRQAIALGLQYYKLSKNNIPAKISTLLVIGNGYAAGNDYEKAIKYVSEANALAAASEDRINQLRTLGFLASQYLRLEMNKKALVYLNDADQIAKTSKIPDSMRYLRGNIYLLKGLVYKHNLDCDFAVSHFNKAIFEFRNQPKNKFARANIAQAYNQKGFCLIEKRPSDSAKASFENAIRSAKENNSQSIIANSLMGLGVINGLEKKTKQAIVYLNQSREIAEKLQLAELKSEVYLNLSKNYLAVNDLVNHRKYEQLNMETASKMNDKQNKVLSKVFKNDRSAEDKNFENDRKDYLYVIGFLLFFILLYIGFVAYKTNRKKKKLKEMKQNSGA